MADTTMAVTMTFETERTRTECRKYFIGRTDHAHVMRHDADFAPRVQSPHFVNLSFAGKMAML